MPITIKDVAKAAGVSITTVSMVLNNTHYKIKEETKEKVRKAAEELGYVPNNLAKSLVTQKSNLIMLMVPNLSNPFFANLCEYIAKEFEKRDYILFIYQTLGKKITIEKFSSIMDANFMAGCLIVDRSVRDFKEELHRKYKIVLLDEIDYSKDKCLMVTGDNEKGGYLAMSYLLDRGHRKIGIVAGPKDTANSSRRIAGALGAVMERDVHFDSDCLVHGNYNYEGGREAYDYLEDKDITAVFCFNDLSAFGFINRAQEKGRKIPEDLSVIGYDNLTINTIIEPKLTTIDQHLEKIAKLGVDILIEHIENREIKKKRHLITPDLCIGKTVEGGPYENTEYGIS